MDEKARADLLARLWSDRGEASSEQMHREGKGRQVVVSESLRRGLAKILLETPEDRKHDYHKLLLRFAEYFREGPTEIVIDTSSVFPDEPESSAKPYERCSASVQFPDGEIRGFELYTQQRAEECMWQFLLENGGRLPGLLGPTPVKPMLYVQAPHLTRANTLDAFCDFFRRHDIPIDEKNLTLTEPSIRGNLVRLAQARKHGFESYRDWRAALDAEAQAAIAENE